MVDVFVDSRAASTMAISCLSRYTNSIKPNGVNVMSLSGVSSILLKSTMPTLPAMIVSGKDAKVACSSVADVLSQISSTSGFAEPLLRIGESDKKQVNDWLTVAEKAGYRLTEKDCNDLNQKLSAQVFLVGTCISLADIAVAAACQNYLKSSNVEQLARIVNVVRWFNHIQSLPDLFLAKQKVTFDLEAIGEAHRAANKKKKDDKAADKKGKDAKKEGEKAGAKEAAPAPEGNKKDKKEKPAKAGERPVADVTRLNMIVGKIVKVWPHAEAEKLWCEEIDCGEGQPRQIASGLREHYKTEADMLNRMCVRAARGGPLPEWGYLGAAGEMSPPAATLPLPPSAAATPLAAPPAHLPRSPSQQGARSAC